MHYRTAIEEYGFKYSAFAGTLESVFLAKPIAALATISSALASKPCWTDANQQRCIWPGDIRRENSEYENIRIRLSCYNLAGVRPVKLGVPSMDYIRESRKAKPGSLELMSDAQSVPQVQAHRLVPWIPPIPPHFCCMLLGQGTSFKLKSSQGKTHRRAKKFKKRAVGEIQGQEKAAISRQSN